jgi:hypothetical protein
MSASKPSKATKALNTLAKEPRNLQTLKTNPGTKARVTGGRTDGRS